jgi:hypothetical protein
LTVAIDTAAASILFHGRVCNPAANPFLENITATASRNNMGRSSGFGLSTARLI